MATPQQFEHIRLLAHRIWEQEGRPEGRDQVHWEQAERQLHDESDLSSATRGEGLKPDAHQLDGDAGHYQQNAPGRPKTASSRQQSQPDQSLQSGSTALDRKSSRRCK